jgi:hypothetical protein
VSVLRGLEGKLEGLFEGLFGRAFRTHVQPVELARKLAKEMDEHRSVSVSRVYVPNEYTLYLSTADRAQFASYEGSLVGELQEYLAEHARREGYALLTSPRVLVSTDDDLAIGEFGIATRLTEPDGPSPALAPVVTLPEPPSAPAAPPVTMVYRPEVPLAVDDDPPAEVAREVVTLTVGDRVVPVSSARVVIGRSREADVQVEDSNVSRRHCELVQENAASWSVTDLGSTNGTEVNGNRIERAMPLAHGDRITVGGTTLVFGRTLP